MTVRVFPVKSLKYIILAFSMLGVISSSAMARIEQSCQIETSSGKLITLGNLCTDAQNVGQEGRKMKPKAWDLDNLDPKFVKHKLDGSWEVKLGAPQPYRLPNGNSYYPDGTTVYSNGLKIKYVVENRKFLGIQYFHKNGISARPGEVVKLPTGEDVEQRGFEK